MLRSALRQGRLLLGEGFGRSLEQLRGSPALAGTTTRCCAALPQPAYSYNEASDHEDAAPSGAEGEAYQRRLQEMASAAAALGTQPAQPGPSAPSWRPWRHSLPSTEEVAERLKTQQGGSACSLPAPAPAADDSPSSSSSSSLLDWREVVEAMRAAQQRVSGEQMLTDSFGRRHTYLRISLTERCNLRCTYCMPEEGVDLTPGSELLNTDEVLRLARLFVGAGVDKVRLTGGEPTLRPDLPEIVGRLAELPGLQAVGLTTNGLALGRKLPALKAAGLKLLNISLDTLQPSRFEALTRRRGHDRVLAAVDSALQLGFEPLKLNVVVMRGVNDDEVPDFVELTRHKPINVRFIEYMPFDGNVWSDRKMVTYRELLQRVGNAFPQGLERCRDPRGEVAKNFRVPGFAGTVSFVTSMTSAFCSDCNRLRVMADGNLKVCLFGANEVSLRDAMREGASDDDLRAIVSAAVDRKKAAHAGMFELAKTPNRAMIKIGG